MELENAVAKQVRAWNTDSEAERLALLRESCEEDAVFLSAYGVNQGVKELSDQIGRFRKSNPGARLTHGPAEQHHGYARFAWTTIFGGDRPSLEGVDFVELDPSGKIRRVVSFHNVVRPAK